MDKIYLLIGNDTPLAVCLRKSEGEETPVPYDLSEARHLRLALVGHGMRVCAKDIEVSGDDDNVVSGMIPGRSLLKGDYDLEVTFTLDGRDKRFAIDNLFEAVDFLADDADGEAEGEGAGIHVTVTVQPELIEIAGPTGPKGDTPVLTADEDGTIYADGVLLTEVVKDVTEAVESAERSRVTAESQRVAAESARVRAEQGRATAEAERASAEGARTTAEQGRVSAEQGRVSAESGRATAESARVAAETARESASATAVQNAETATAAANTAAEHAEEAATTIDEKIAGKADQSEVSQLGQEVGQIIVSGREYFTNLLDGITSEEDKYIGPSSGNIANNPGYTATSDYIPVSEETDYLFYGFGKVYGAWYNSSKSRIDGITENSNIENGEKYTSPSGAAYLRVSTQTTFYSGAEIYEDGIIQMNPRISLPQSAVDDLRGYTDTRVGEIVPGINDEIALSGLSNIRADKMISPSNGGESTAPGHSATDYIDVDAETDYRLYGFGPTYGAWYTSGKVYISGIIMNTSPSDGTKISSPANAAYLRISTQTSKFPDAVITDNLLLSSKISVRLEQVEGFDVSDQIKTTILAVKPGGGGDFTTLSAAFASITDASFNNRYVVKFYGDGTEYDTLQDLAYSSGQVGLKVPVFTKLVGVGGPDKCILVRRLSAVDQNDSLLNLNNTSEVEGFTMIADKTRYVVHDDFYTQAGNDLLNYPRVVKNCRFIAARTYYYDIYGAGMRSGNTWVFENCVFESGEGYDNVSFTCHNNTGFTNPAYIKFINCRFNAVRNDICIRLGSLNTGANGITNVVEFYGNKMQKLQLSEENAGNYGAGILFKATGFGNDLKTGSSNITIINTDGVDYSENIDLI